MKKIFTIVGSKRPDTGKCVIWTRVSTEYQEKNGNSLDYQKKICRDYANEQKLEIAREFGGSHESAKVMGAMMKEMLAYVKKNPDIKYIIVSEPDRFSRRAGEALSTLEKLKKMGVVIVAVKCGIRTDSHEGEMMMGVSSVLASYDNSKRVDKFLSGRYDCLQKGIWVEKAPLGYIKEGKSKNTVCRLDDNGKLLRLAFRWKLNHLSNNEILKKLETRGLALTKQQLHKVLTNPFYAGKIRHKAVEGIIDGCHEQAVSWLEFLRVQDILSDRTGKYTHTNQLDECPLKRCVFCAKDNKPLTFYSKKKNGKHYGYYKCNDRGCRTNISAQMLHLKFHQLMQSYSIPESLKPIIADDIMDALKECGFVVSEQIPKLKGRLTEVREKIQKVKIRFGGGDIDKDVYDVTIRDLRNQEAELDSELKQSEEFLSNSNVDISKVLSTCCNLDNLWNNSNTTIKEKLQKTLFPSGIFWDGQMSSYRTPECNKAIDLISKISTRYKKEKATDIDSSVALCG